MPNYDDEGAARRSISSVVGWSSMFVVMTFASAFVFRLLIPDLVDGYYLCTVAKARAATYIGTEVCTSAAVKSQLENYNHCEDSARTLAGSCYVSAFFHLMENLSFCKTGICNVFGENLAGRLWYLSQLLLVAYLALYVYSAAMTAMAIHARTTGMNQLPLFNSKMAAGKAA